MGRWTSGIALLLLLAAGAWLLRGDGAGDTAGGAAPPQSAEPGEEHARPDAELATAAQTRTDSSAARAEAAAATASLEVAVVDAAGVALLGVDVLVVVTSTEHDVGRPDTLAHARTTSGTQVFPELPARVRVAVEVSADSPWSAVRMPLAEPLAGSRRVEVVLPFDGTIVAGRALRSDGEPLANDAVWANFAWIRPDGRTGSPGQPAATDAEGQFSARIRGGSSDLLTFPTGLAEPPGEVTADERWRFELVLTDDPAVGALRSEPARLPSPPWPTVIEVGELVLAGLPLFVAGTVVDPGGAGVAGAELWFTLAPGEARDLATVRRQMESIPRNPGGRSGEDGRFAVQGQIDSSLARMELRALHPEYLEGEPVEFVPGSAEVVVRLARGGFLEGSLIADDRERVSSVRLSLIELEPREEGHSRNFIRAAHQSRYGLASTNTRSHGLELQPARDGTFGFGPLRPGRHEFRARLGTHAVPFLVVPDIEIREGEVNRDPRMQAIGISLPELELTVLDPALAPVPDGYVLYGAGGELDGLAYVRNGAATLVARELPLDVLVCAPGLREATLAGVRGDAEVVLATGVPVELLLPAGAVVPPGWTLIAIWAEPRLDTITWGYDSPLSAEFDEGGVARMTAPRIGTLELALEGVRREGGGRTLYSAIPLPERERFVEVRDEPGTCLIEVAVSAELLAERLRD